MPFIFRLLVWLSISSLSQLLLDSISQFKTTNDRGNKTPKLPDVSKAKVLQMSWFRSRNSNKLQQTLPSNLVWLLVRWLKNTSNEAEKQTMWRTLKKPTVFYNLLVSSFSWQIKFVENSLTIDEYKRHERVDKELHRWKTREVLVSCSLFIDD